ncbi:MAG: hypothetical protein E7062_04105 [Spirochaetaceae bacterium]|nr:hypothetical protein [Spirochaetaceae bacterium]
MKTVFLKKVGWIICGITCLLLSLSGASCNISSTGIEVVPLSETPPKLLTHSFIDESSLMMSFSGEVLLKNLQVFEKTSEGEIFFSDATSKKSETRPFSEDVNAELVYNLEITFDKNTICGKNYVLSGNAEDLQGNSLLFEIAFTGFNNRIPKIILSEIRSTYTKPKYEFIELFVLTDGNLAGMELLSAYDGVEANYIFPAVEVKKGEYIVLHMRNDGDGCIDELDDNLNCSTYSESVENVRDLWISNTSARIGNSDVILLKNRKDGQIIDGVLFSQSESTGWQKELQAEYAQMLFQSGIWKEGSDVTCAANSDGVTVTRTLSRQNISSLYENFTHATLSYPFSVDKSEWFVVATSNVSMGKENSSKPYVKVSE